MAAPSTDLSAALATLRSRWGAAAPEFAGERYVGDVVLRDENEFAVEAQGHRWPPVTRVGPRWETLAAQAREGNGTKVTSGSWWR